LQLLVDSQAFVGQYTAGREQGLVQVDAARSHPMYGAYQYKVRRARGSLTGSRRSRLVPASKLSVQGVLRAPVCP